LGKEKGGKILIGFAAESGRLRERALAKLNKKGLDFIVGNLVAGEEDAMGADAARATIFDPSGGSEVLPRLEKADLAGRILDRLADLWQKKK
jgi:phosphopantothenoylcysteine decarboxylase/phosphopantothenate--cysteine ligase